MNILIVDDTKFIRDIVSSIINKSGHNAIVAQNHHEAFTALQTQKINLILMDIEMPKVDGFMLTQQIRERYKEWIPIIFLSANDSEHYLSRAIDAGGDDYLTKPVKEVILVAKIRAMERIALMKEALDKANQQLAKLSNIDPLTQVLNRRGFESMLSKSLHTNLRLKGHLSLLILDIDHFKEYNDHYGHLKGDQCITNVATIISDTLNRATDIVARYGGDEFVVVLPFTPIDGARFKAGQMINQLHEAGISHQQSPTKQTVTLSIGIATSEGMDVSANALIEQADAALYLAKKYGRNRYQVFEN